MKAKSAKNWYEPKNAYWDMVVLFGILLLVNIVLSPDDPGMTSINPSPFVLLPVLIGCRYGFADAMKSCLLIIVVHVGALMTMGQTLDATGSAVATGLGITATDGMNVTNIILVHGFFYAGLIFLGGVCGEVHSFFMTQENEIKLINNQLVSRHTALEETVYELSQIKKKFEEELVSYGSETASLDISLRLLMDCEKDSIYIEILRLFNRFYEVQVAAIYLQDNEGMIRRQAVIGASENLPEFIELDRDVLAKKCLMVNSPVSIKSFSDLEVTQIDHLLALPISNTANEASGVVLINAMPFNRLTEASVEGMELLSHWASRSLEVHHERWLVEMVGDQKSEHKFISNEAFSDIILIANRTASIYQIPSFLVMLYTNGEDRHLEEELKAKFLPQIRRGDFVTSLDLPYSNLAVLLPVAGRRSVEIFLDRMNEIIAANSRLSGRVRNVTKIVDDQFDIKQFTLEVKNIGSRRENALV